MAKTPPAFSFADIFASNRRNTVRFSKISREGASAVIVIRAVGVRYQGENRQRTVSSVAGADKHEWLCAK